jgi:hypothetical protein
MIERKIERRLTADDQERLELYEGKCAQVKKWTRLCVEGVYTGLMLFGAGGNGKSYSIRETLAEMKMREVEPEETRAPDDDEGEDEHGLAVSKPAAGHDTWVNHQGRITPKGLVKQMDAFPESLHLIEDAETMWDDKNAWGVLRMALHSQDRRLYSLRRVTWSVSTRDSYDFYFRGSLVIVANRPLPEKHPEVEAVKTRWPCLKFDVSNQELIAKMKSLCERGYDLIDPKRPLTKDECYDVLEYMLGVIESDPAIKHDQRGVEKKLNLRILDMGFRLMWNQRYVGPDMDWREMLTDQLKQVVGHGRRTRRDRVDEQAEIAREIFDRVYPSQHEKIVEWCLRTGRSTDWASQPRGSDAYQKGFGVSKADYHRKLRRGR